MRRICDVAARLRKTISPMEATNDATPCVGHGRQRQRRRYAKTTRASMSRIVQNTPSRQPARDGRPSANGRRKATEALPRNKSACTYHERERERDLLNCVHKGRVFVQGVQEQAEQHREALQQRSQNCGSN
jgi:hypothetical protein